MAAIRHEARGAAHEPDGGYAGTLLLRRTRPSVSATDPQRAVADRDGPGAPWKGLIVPLGGSKEGTDQSLSPKRSHSKDASGLPLSCRH